VHVLNSQMFLKLNKKEKKLVRGVKDRNVEEVRGSRGLGAVLRHQRYVLDRLMINLRIACVFLDDLKARVVRDTPSQDGIAILIVAVFIHIFKTDSFLFSLFLNIAQ
jgi:hypothetical protein